MKRLALAALLAGSAAVADAGTLVDVTVRDLDTGRVLTAYAQAGREFVAGAPGHRYAVTLRNNTPERVLAVLSVDGVNAVSARTASPQQSGYVLEPWQQTEIRGWRKSLNDVAEFVFTSVPDSYAARTGRPENVGVIGVAVFREAQPYPPYAIAEEDVPWYDPYAKGERSARDRAAAPPAPAAGTGSAAAEARSAPKSHYDDGLAGRRQDLGTGHGRRRYDPASYTEFERASSSPDEVVAIHYDSWQALVDRGVIPRRHWRRWDGPREADPFPVGFVPDPRW
jgi:hypothetical protein